MLLKDLKTTHNFTKNLRTMKLTRQMKRISSDVFIVILFLAISVFYFHIPLSQGLVLGGHDSEAAYGLGQEQLQYRASHDGETTRWTNAIFSGMPTYQIAPSYSATDTVYSLSKIYGLGTNDWFPAVGYLFVYMLGFYVMLRAFNFKPYLAALGSIIWAFSSYFLIIIAAGHIWKVLTLAYIPPTIGGLVLCYRGRYLWGGAVTALFTAFQVVSNHLQMTYYFLFVMLFMAVAYGVYDFMRKRYVHWFKATAVLAFSGLLGVAANLPNLYHTYEYTQHSMRGKSELTAQTTGKQSAADATEGLDRSYITAWSYGIDETMTLLIPDYKGGGSGSIFERKGVEQLEHFDDFRTQVMNMMQTFQQNGIQANPPGINQYWGDQPFTVGPVYIGAFVCFLFILGFFVVNGPMKWALFLATLLSMVFAWGHNIPAVTNFLIDHLPLYNKFRTVSSALVIAEFTIPLLGVLCIQKIMRRKEMFRLSHWDDVPFRAKLGIPVAAVLTLGICLVLWMFPSMAGDCLSSEEQQVFAYLESAQFSPEMLNSYKASLTGLRHDILSADALRSALFILGGIVLMWIYAEEKIKSWMLCTFLSVLFLADLSQVDKKYLNDGSFTSPMVMEQKYAETPADTEILKDKSYYRVANLGGGNTFNETSNATSYYHHSIGGYHAAKLRRYQDLITYRLTPEIQALWSAVAEADGNMAMVPGDSIAPVLNMLNTKYFIFGQGAQSMALRNPYANGNAWFVSKLSFVKNADAEIAALKGLDTKHEAVADESFKAQLDGTALGQGSVEFLSYEPNELKYEVESTKGGLLVFSEIYYPGWKAMIDGQEVELGRVNYVLRALKVPAGKHEIVLEFRPVTLSVTNSIAWSALAIILIFMVIALIGKGRHFYRMANSDHK